MHIKEISNNLQSNRMFFCGNFENFRCNIGNLIDSLLGAICERRNQPVGLSLKLRLRELERPFSFSFFPRY